MKKKDKTIGVSATLLAITGAVISWIVGRKYSSPYGVFAIFVIMGLYFIFIGRWFIKIPVNERETLHIWWHLNTKKLGEKMQDLDLSWFICYFLRSSLFFLACFCQF